jgi:NTE family protein
MTAFQFPTRPKSYDKAVALVLQGGGALGSYQAGVYEALSHSAYPPDWIAGISIGAINAAIIAGNAPHLRVQKLRAFWEKITSHTSPLMGLHAYFPTTEMKIGSLSALTFGQPGFFAPRQPFEWFFGTPPNSFYNTDALRETLLELIDFKLINSRQIGFSVGAVDVLTGNFVYFNNVEREIRVEHIMASGALPPGFPAVEIDGEHYWDGGLVSNTPLQYVLEYVPRRSRLTFQVDVFPSRGRLPDTIDDVVEREKDIRYASRTRAGTDFMRRMHDVRHNINTLWDKLPDELRNTPEGEFLYNFGCVTTMDIAQLIYRPEREQGPSKDYEFSRSTMEARWAAGLADATQTLNASPWLAPMPPEVGARTFDVVRDAMRRRAAEEGKGQADQKKPEKDGQAGIARPAGKAHA